MPKRCCATCQGFSLVELVIVIVIIGIIAAIAVPRVSRGTTGAAESALKGNLAALRGAIDKYAAEHGGAFPGLHKNDGSQNSNGSESDFYAQLTLYSCVTGKTGSYDPAASPPCVFGPYLREMPRLNVGKNATLKADEIGFNSDSPPHVAENNKKGWMYNPETGEIVANTTASDSLGTPYEEY